MSDFLFKPVKINYIKYIIQYIFGIILILLIASIIETKSTITDNWVEEIFVYIHDNFIEFASMAGNHLVPITIILTTFFLGGFFLEFLEHIFKTLLTLYKIAEGGGKTDD